MFTEELGSILSLSYLKGFTFNAMEIISCLYSYTRIKDLLISNRYISLLMSLARSLKGLLEHLISFLFSQMPLSLLPFSNNSLTWWHSSLTRTHLLQRRWFGPSFSDRHQALCTSRGLQTCQKVSLGEACDMAPCCGNSRWGRSFVAQKKCNVGSTDCWDRGQGVSSPPQC